MTRARVWSPSSDIVPGTLTDVTLPVTRIGTIDDVNPGLIENLFAADFDHLQRLYERINSDGEAVGVVSCPECSHQFEVDLTEIEDGRLGE